MNYYFEYFKFEYFKFETTSSLGKKFCISWGVTPMPLFEIWKQKKAPKFVLTQRKKRTGYQ